MGRLKGKPGQTPLPGPPEQAGASGLHPSNPIQRRLWPNPVDPAQFERLVEECEAQVEANPYRCLLILLDIARRGPLVRADEVDELLFRLSQRLDLGGGPNHLLQIFWERARQARLDHRQGDSGPPSGAPEEEDFARSYLMLVPPDPGKPEEVMGGLVFYFEQFVADHPELAEAAVEECRRIAERHRRPADAGAPEDRHDQLRREVLASGNRPLSREPLFLVGEAARILRVRENTLRRYAERNDIGVVKDRRRRLSMQDLRDYLLHPPRRGRPPAS